MAVAAFLLWTIKQREKLTGFYVVVAAFLRWSMEIVRFCVVTLKTEWSYSVSQKFFSVNMNHMTFGLIYMMQMMRMINEIEKSHF